MLIGTKCERLRAMQWAWGVLAPSCFSARGSQGVAAGRALSLEREAPQGTAILVGLSGRRHVMIQMSREGDVHVLQMDAGENRFDASFIGAWNDALDHVEGARAPKALVTIGTGKFYSNGLDLDYMMSDGVDRNEYLKQVLAIMGRILVFPCLTVAAMNGHAFGAGAQLALAHDNRVMRNDRGYFCMPEIDMKAPLHPGMTAIIMARLPHQSAHEVIVTGTRYGAAAALERRIVDRACAEEEVLRAAIELAAPLAGKANEAMRVLKRGMYPHVLGALGADLF